MKAVAGRPRGHVRAPPVWAAVLVAAASAFTPTAGHACGACVEDKIAATYDHGVVKRAQARGNVVVFCEVTGPLAAQGLKDVVRKIGGVNRQSVRVSTQPAALSFAVDPRQRSPQAAVDAVQRAVPPGTRVSIVRLLPVKAL